MPRRDHVTLPGFYSAFDVTPWAGLDVCTVGIAGAPTVTVPTIASGSLGDPDVDDVGEYLDVVEAMTGYGSETDGHLGALLTAAWAALGQAGNIGVTINGSDQMRFTLDAPSLGGALIAPLGVDVFGLGGEITVPGEGGENAAGDWIRGVTDAEAQLLVTVPNGGSLSVDVPRVHDARIAIRERGAVGDADDRWRWCVEDGDATLRMGVTSDGRAWWATSRAGALTGMVWDSTTFRDRLGFTGYEAITTWGDWRGQIADHPLPGVTHTTRPIRRQNRRVDVAGSDLRLVSGSYSGVHVGTYRGWSIEAWVDGPLDSGLDLHTHWLDMMSEPAYCTPGRPITVYQDVGDSRRALDPRSVNADQPAYDVLYTSEHGPYRGRLLCRVNPATGRELELSQEGQYRRRYPVSITVDDREDGV